MKSQNIYLDKTKKKIFFENMIGGLGWSLGTVFGAVIIVSILSYLAAKIHAVPYIGEFVYGIIQEVQKLQGK